MVSVATERPIRLADCQLRLPTFEGPLDVLLRMIERSQLDITDLSLVAVTDQFVAYVATLSNVPPSVLAEFTAIAARLLALKTRSLLPAPPAVEEEPETDDLTQQLIAYQAVKAAAAHLRERERAGLRSFPRVVQPPDLPVSEHFAPVPLARLVQALHRGLNRRRPEPKTYTPTRVISLAEMTRRMLDRLRPGRNRFSSLVGESPTRTELAVAFIALLSLLRQRVLDATQATLFGDIEVERIAPRPEAADD